MSGMTLFLISFLVGAACTFIGGRMRGVAAILTMIAGLLLILFGGYGVFTAFV